VLDHCRVCRDIITMQIWYLPSNEKDAVAFLQERGVLPKIRLCGSGHEAK